MQRLLLIGLNHTTAPLTVREKLAFGHEQQRRAILQFKERFPECEFVLLSTCNRVEVYVARTVHAQPSADELAAFLAEFHGARQEEFSPHLYEKSQHGVSEHLFAVTASLDSMVLGETQILGQVREAYELASQLGATGRMLNPLFQRAIAAAKQVLSETPLAEGRLSVASVGVEFARRVFERFDDKTVLTIGAGKVAQLVLQSFAQLAPKRLLICNRDAAKAQATAGRFSGAAVPFDQLQQSLVDADIVISSTGSAHPILAREHFENAIKARRYRAMFVIDLAVPRDVDVAAGELEHVYLYNIDDLQSVVSATQSQRQDALRQAREILAIHVSEFVAWLRARELGPAIDRLYKRYHDLARQELQRTLGKMPDLPADEQQQLHDLVRRIVNKVLHDPVQSLRNGDPGHSPEIQYLHAMEKLFKLDAVEESETES